MRIFGRQAKEWIDELRSELMPGEAIPLFLQCDSIEAFRFAEPRGGIFPNGIAGRDLGNWEEEESSPSTMSPLPASEPRSPSPTASCAPTKSGVDVILSQALSWNVLLAFVLLVVALTAAWPTSQSSPADLLG